jgi:hypothetical protein
MLTKERLQDFFHENTQAVKGEVVLHYSKFNDVYELILKELQPAAEVMELKKVHEFVEAKQKEFRSYFSCGSLLDQVAHVVETAERGSRTAIADKRKLIEDALVYFRSVILIAESIGMAATHAEKAARLRGLIELLNSAISKLRNDQQEHLLQNWESFSWGYSDYPYHRILEKYSELERQNKQMKEALEKNGLGDELPF